MYDTVKFIPDGERRWEVYRIGTNVKLGVVLEQDGRLGLMAALDPATEDSVAIQMDELLDIADFCKAQF